MKNKIYLVIIFICIAYVIYYYSVDMKKQNIIIKKLQFEKQKVEKLNSNKLNKYREILTLKNSYNRLSNEINSVISSINSLKLYSEDKIDKKYFFLKIDQKQNREFNINNHIYYISKKFYFNEWNNFFYKFSEALKSRYFLRNIKFSKKYDIKNRKDYFYSEMILYKVENL